MYCQSCGVQLQASAVFCSSCGKQLNIKNPDKPAVPVLKGFSSRINDPAFSKYIKNSNRWAALFSIILACVAIVGFYIAGEKGIDNIENPQGLYIGLGVGGMFLLIAFFQIVGKKRSKTWDGRVEDKKVKKKTESQSYSDGSVRYEDYLEYQVIIRCDSGKRYVLRAKNDDTMYNYYRIGDLVRHHGGLNSYEKYDKTLDSFIPCNACATLCDIKDDVCFRCKCPLLK